MQVQLFCLFISLCLTQLVIIECFSPILSNSLSHRRMSTQINESGDNKNEKGNSNGFLDGINNFFKDLDDFMDDASARRLGNGAAFYGKRKSKFYGKDDKNRKENSNIANPIEDYQAPNTGGYFQWMQDENGEMKPVTRMKKTIVERNPSFWDRLYDKENKDQ